MALLQRKQSFQPSQRDGDDVKQSSVKTHSTSTVGEAAAATGGGDRDRDRGIRRASSLMGLTGPRTAAPLAMGSTSTPSTTTTNPTSSTFFGLLATKRLARRFASRFHRRRLGTMSSLLSSGGMAGPPLVLEPTYRMEPHRKFRPTQVESMLQTVLEERMNKCRYSARICANMCKILGDDIKERVKQMNFDRYKIVSNVVIGQKKDQAVIMCSRCAWDDKLDNFASYTFQNEHVFCTATVFGIYME